MVNILYFDPFSTIVEDIAEIYDQLQKVLPEDTVIALPYGMSLMMNIPMEELINIRDLIDALIKMKENKDNNDL